MVMTPFEQLVTSRKEWIENVLKPWCSSANRAALLQAEVEWTDLAGKVDPQKTLWLWAWSRFPELVHEALGIEETMEVDVFLADGRRYSGFPDARKSTAGKLVLWGHLLPETVRQFENGGAVAEFASTEMGPFSIDDIVSVTRQVAGE